MNFPSKIVIGSDHAGFEYKTEIIEFLRKIDISIIDVGRILRLHAIIQIMLMLWQKKLKIKKPKWEFYCVEVQTV